MSISFEDLQVGQRWQSTGRTLTDADFAKASNGRQFIFHGTYGLHIAIALATRLPDLGSDIVGALGFRERCFRTPLLTDDTVHIEE
jgi:acyl dehydratase